MASKTADRFHGAWTLASYEQRQADGTVTHPMGADPVGRLTYDAGRMWAQMMRRDRPRFASGTRQGTADEIQAAFAGFIGYYGPYRVDEQSGTVIHHVECCSFPNWVGTDQVRRFEFDGDRLTLRAPGADNSEYRLVWMRKIL
jgi:hypothetical protein